MASPARPGEFDLIRRYFAPLAAGNAAALDLRDDAALLTPPPGRQLVLTTDTIVAGIHYPESDSPEDVARRVLRVNLSDLAAMGARPEGYLLNVALPRSVGEAWVASFSTGLAEDQARYGLALLGGDTVSTPGPTTLTLTAIGSVPAGSALARSGARQGDVIHVSGTIGEGVFGLWAVQHRLPREVGPEECRALIEAFRAPEPRLALGQALARRRLATAAADVSDGLLADLGHICEASGLGATLRAWDVPLSPAGRAVVGSDVRLLTEALTGGDDYELVFTAAPEAVGPLQALGQELGVPVAAIGVMEAGEGVTALGADGRPLAIERLGFQHS